MGDCQEGESRFFPLAASANLLRAQRFKFGKIMTLIIRSLGCQDYVAVFRAMQRFTDCRNDTTPDEIWLLQHHPVYTQGMAGRPEHILNPGAIPVVAIDRGGQVTYHGPGQLVVYFLLDVKRRQLAPRQLVSLIE